MLLSTVLLQAAAGVGLSKVGAALGAGLAVIGAGLVARLWKLLHASRKFQVISV